MFAQNNVDRCLHRVVDQYVHHKALGYLRLVVPAADESFLTIAGNA